MNRYGYELPAGTKLQRHLMSMVSSLQQYAAVYIKHVGEATPTECTHQALLYSKIKWPVVTSSDYERVCIAPLDKLDSKQQQQLSEDTLLVDIGLLVRTYVSNASAAVREVPQLPPHAVFYRPAGKCGVVPIMHQTTTGVTSNAEAVTVAYPVTATSTTTTTTTGTDTSTKQSDDVHNLPTQFVTVKFGAVEFSCNVVVLVAAAVEGCAVLDTHASGLDWEISNYLQLVECSN